jgi:hypothetical protein
VHDLRTGADGAAADRAPADADTDADTDADARADDDAVADSDARCDRHAAADPDAAGHDAADGDARTDGHRRADVAPIADTAAGGRVLSPIPAAALIAVALSYATASAAGTLAVAEFGPRCDGAARTGDLSAHGACALGAGVVGAALATRIGALETLAVTGVAVAVLAASAFAGFRRNGLPPGIPLGALALVLAAALARGITPPFLAAAFAGAPFVITALVARDARGSLRDGAVAAIGGSILGISYGIGATIVGSIVGALALRTQPRVEGRSFAPYLACAIGLATVAFALFYM